MKREPFFTQKFFQEMAISGLLALAIVAVIHFFPWLDKQWLRLMH